MNPGEMKTVLSFTLVTSAVTNGDAVESPGAPVNIRGKLIQLEGYKKMQYTELLTKKTYQFECYDNSSITDGATCLYGSESLVIHSIIPVENLGKPKELKIILYKK